MLSECFYPRFISSSNREEQQPSTSSANSDTSIELELGLIHNASGSAYLNFGGSKVIVSVHGPYARAAAGGVFSSTGQIECTVKYAASVGAIAEQGSTVQSQTIIDALQGNVRLDEYAKMTISISVVILETQGCELAHSICCASLALLNAGVEMLDLICASSVVKRSDGTLIFNPTRCQISQYSNCVTIATAPTTGDVTQVWFDGKEDLASTFEMIRKCSDYNSQLRLSFRDKILSSLREE